MSLIINIIDLINKYLKVIIALLLGVMALLITTQVLTRFLIPFSFPWTEEVARYIMIYIIFLAAALANRNQELIAVEFVLETMSEKKRRILKKVINCISIIFFLTLMAKGLEFLPSVHLQTSPGLNIPMSIPYASIPIGSFFLALNSFAVIFSDLRSPGEVKQE